MKAYKPTVIYLDSDSGHDVVAHKILNRFADVPVVPVHDYLSDWTPEPDKNSLLLTHNRGRFLRACPGTRSYLCCGYQIVDFAAGCTLGCSYCILQAYLNFPGLVFYTNWEEMWKELESRLGGGKRHLLRIGTGEFTDSLLFDKLTDFSQYLIPRLVKHDSNIVLELKTKTDQVDNLQGIEHNNQVVVSWSLNTSKIVEEEEANAPGLDERLDAAVRCQDWGYRLGFHFDPLIYYPGWEEGYQAVIDKMFACINPDKILWISMGCLRFMPSLPKFIRDNHPQSKIIWEEFIAGDDGKMRYFKGLRIKMYSTVLANIRRYAPDVLVYLCMESPGVWQEVFGEAPANNHAFKVLLDECC